MTKKMTITISGNMGEELIKQFVEALPKDDTEFKTGLESAIKKYDIPCDNLEEILAHRDAMCAMARRIQAAMELGVDIEIGDDPDFMEDCEEQVKTLARKCASKQTAAMANELCEKFGIADEDLPSLVRMIESDPTAPKELKEDVLPVLRGRIEGTDSPEIDHDLAKELASEGATILPFTGRKDN